MCARHLLVRKGVVPLTHSLKHLDLWDSPTPALPLPSMPNLRSLTLGPYAAANLWKVLPSLSTLTKLECLGVQGEEGSVLSEFDIPLGFKHLKCLDVNFVTENPLSSPLAEHVHFPCQVNF